MRAFQHLLDQGAKSKAWRGLIDLEAAHRAIIADIDAEYLSFPRLDEQFHRVLMDGLKNRFMDDFLELVSVIFHYHYRWNKQDELARNLTAAHQHLDVIHALKAGDTAKALVYFQQHLISARTTLLKSVSWEAEA